MNHSLCLIGAAVITERKKCWVFLVRQGILVSRGVQPWLNHKHIPLTFYFSPFAMRSGGLWAKRDYNSQLASDFLVSEMCLEPKITGIRIILLLMIPDRCPLEGDIQYSFSSGMAHLPGLLASVLCSWKNKYKRTKCCCVHAFHLLKEPMDPTRHILCPLCKVDGFRGPEDFSKVTQLVSMTT